MNKLLANTIFSLVVVLAPVHAIASTLYISDSLRVGVRSAPGTQIAPHAVLTTGAALTLIKEEGKYSKIRTADGTEGWVRSIYLTSSSPAKTRLPQAQAEIIRANEEIIRLQKRLESAGTEKNDMQKRIDLLNDDIYNLHQKLASLDPNARQQWIYLTIIILALSALSFTVGILWHKQQVAKKLGGHTL